METENAKQTVTDDIEVMDVISAADQKTGSDERSGDTDARAKLVEDLHMSIVNGNLSLYKSIMSTSPYVTQQFPCRFQGSGILHQICDWQRDHDVGDYIRDAIQNGCDVRGKDRNSDMPIHVACSVANHHAVKFLADHDRGLCNENQSLESYSPLMVAIRQYTSEKASDFVKTVEALLKSGADVCGKSYRYTHTVTPLLSALFHREKMPDIVRILLNAGSDVHARSFMYRTPLIQAVSQNDQQSVRYLLEANSDPNAKDNMGWTPLLVATYKQYKHIMRDLVQHGADLNCEINKNNKTVLCDAIKTSGYDVTKLLFELGLKITTDLLWTQNPVVCAIEQKSVNHLKALLRENCPLDEPWHELPLIEAVRPSNVDAGVLDILIQVGADFSDAQLECALTAKPDDEALSELVTRYHGDVRPLKTLCCFAIRKCLGLGIEQRLKRLVEQDVMLPQSLVSAVMLEHVLDI